MTFIKNNSYLLLIVVLFISFIVVGIQKQDNDVVFEEVLVVEGDTLWEMANNYTESTSNEKWIKKVMKLNNLSSTNIKVGYDLKIPIMKENHSNDRKRNIATSIGSDSK